MAARQDHMFYQVSPPPQGGDPALTQWMIRELERIANSLQAGRHQALRMDVYPKALPKAVPGFVVFFASGVVGPTEGLYEYRGGAWTKL